MAKQKELTRLQKFDLVVERIREEAISVKKACVGIMSRTDFHEILKVDEERVNNYTRACEERAMILAEETIEIADNCEPKVANVMKANMQIGARQWYASKVNPKKYGNKVEADLNVDGQIQINLDLGS